MKHCLPKILALLSFAGLALSANAAPTVITPTSEVATSQFGDWIDTIDGTGLSGGGTSGDILNETHAAGGGGNFALFPGGPDFTGESITFTLVEASRVDRVHLWLDRSVWGDVTGFDLEFSTNGGITFPTTAAGITFDGAAGDLSVVQTRTFVEQTDVTHIRLSNVVVTGGDTAYAGFNEIRFGGDAAPDTTPPTLAGSNIVDDQGGASVNENTLVTYTVTFSEDIDDTTVSSADFSNAGTSPISFGAITEISPGVFTVAVTPTAAGTLQLQVPIGATIKDTVGLSMLTTSAVVDDTAITVTVAPPDTTKPTPDPMSFATAPAPSSATSITMEATLASDAAGVEYLFTETSGNPGGDSSGWQGSPNYEDTGLTTGLQYTYTVTARDLSSNQNTTAPSDPASATAETPVIPPVITVPTSRHIVQRSATNVGTIVIAGTYSVGSPEEVEARAVVMAGGGNSGTTTVWQTIDASPTGGNFYGVLTNVPAGGWYQLEVRTMISGVPGGIAVMEKVGVGDIYVTAGQSNSVNSSPPGYIPSDDRISARSSLTEDTWVFAQDPVPTFNSGDAGWGSVWTRLGDMLADAEDIPIGFHVVGVGATRVSQWNPNLYNSQIKPAVQSFPVNGFRAILWHQGEHDGSFSTPAASYAADLQSVIAMSRTDAGWNVPWYVAEASYWSALQREPVVAGQRMAIHGDPFTFFGENTEDFAIKGYGLHYNEVGTLERAALYTTILAGTPTLAPVNGHFEDNSDPTIRGSFSPLTDGTSALLSITDNLPVRPIGWHILTASGVNAADGANGYHNPSTGTFAGAMDTVNGGVLPNMDGKHVALLDGGTAGNYFLHSTRALAKANTTYTLTVALGLRDNAATFGTARLEITADGVVVASTSFDKAAIDALHGSDASGTFTDATITWTTGSTVAANQPMAIRVVKEGGSGTVLDFDNARFTATALNDFNSWIDDFSLPAADQDFTDDPDGDGLENGLEAWFGTHPSQFTSGLADISTTGLTTTFTHLQNTSPPDDLTSYYEWSPNLSDWYPSGNGPSGGPVITFTASTSGSTTTVTATASEDIDRTFIRAGVSQN